MAVDRSASIADPDWDGYVVPFIHSIVQTFSVSWWGNNLAVCIYDTDVYEYMPMNSTVDNADTLAEIDALAGTVIKGTFTNTSGGLLCAREQLQDSMGDP